MTGRERPTGKATRYLAAGRLDVTSVGADHIAATCTGDTGTYTLGHHGDWHCDCPARGTRCSHLIALRLVTVRTDHQPTEHP